MDALAVLKQKIARDGPMSIHNFMAFCLMDKDYGYYQKKPVFGTEGDFVTAPEISQMFGEMIAIWLVQCWDAAGRPDDFILLELGPGLGTLMSDILRATKSLKPFQAGARIFLLERSDQLKEKQKSALNDADITWISKLSDLPKKPLFFVANEFFDALPIYQYQKIDTHWFERVIDLKDGALVFSTRYTPHIAIDQRLTFDKIDGDIVELSPSALSIAQELSQHISQHSGAGVIIDYGNWGSLGDTLQAVQKHKVVDPLKEPGQADLTAHVDFHALSRNVSCNHSKMVPQGVFLEHLGITERAKHLAQNLEGAALATHIAAHKRLTHPEEMGRLFKALAFYSKDMTPPIGFSHDP